MTDEVSSRSADVVIVGFGPVGKLLAVHLGRRGHSVVVVERKSAAYPLPRAVTHDSDFARILQSVGLPPDAIPAITEPYDDMYVWRNGAGRTLLEVDWSGRGESGWFNTYFFNQPALEDALDCVIAELPTVEVMRGWEATHLDQEVASATVTLHSAGAEEQVAVTASWVIGADGANSDCRRWAGIHWHDEGYFYDWLVVDVKPTGGQRFPHIAAQNCDPTRPSTMVPGGPGRRRWEFMRLPHESKELLNSTDTAWALLEPYGITPADADLERHSVYTFQACWATRWRAGRLLLAGDAAHLMPPFAGQGLGAGARDVMNLSWKLDAVLRGLASEQLIDTYEPERLAHARTFVMFSVQLGQVICIADPAAADQRDDRMIRARTAGMDPPAPPRPGLGAGLHKGRFGGSLARQGRVRLADDAAPLLFDDAFGGPGALIARSTDLLSPLDPAACTRLDQLHIDLVALRGRPADGVAVVDDVDGTYRAWLDDMSADVVLVRPDFHVYAAGAGHDATALVGDFLTDLTSGAIGPCTSARAEPSNSEAGSYPGSASPTVG